MSTRSPSISISPNSTSSTLSHVSERPFLNPRDDFSRRWYSWLPTSIPVIAFIVIIFACAGLYFVERRLIAAMGESLSLTAADIAHNIDRLQLERYDDVLMLAKALAARPADRDYQMTYLAWMREIYPVYIWLGVTDADGRVVAATDAATLGRDMSGAAWFITVRKTGTPQVNDVEPYEAAGGVEALAFSAPMIDRQGRLLGVVTTRVACRQSRIWSVRRCVPLQPVAGCSKGRNIRYSPQTERLL